MEYDADQPKALDAPINAETAKVMIKSWLMQSIKGGFWLA